MTNEELSTAIKKVAASVAQLIEPVAASLAELERARKARRNGIALIAFLVLAIQATQFYLIASNRALIRQVQATMTACLPVGEPSP